MSGREKLKHESAIRWRVDLAGFSAADVLSMRIILKGLYEGDAEEEGIWVRWAIEHSESPEEVLGRLRDTAGL